MSINRWMYKQTLINTYNAIHPSNKKEWSFDKYNFSGALCWGKKQNKTKQKLISRGHRLYDSIYTTSWNDKLVEMENRLVVAMGEEWWEGAVEGGDYKGVALGRSLWCWHSSVCWLRWWLHKSVPVIKWQTLYQVSFLLLILYYSFARCNHWRKLVEGIGDPLALSLQLPVTLFQNEKFIPTHIYTHAFMHTHIWYTQ